MYGLARRREERGGGSEEWRAERRRRGGGKGEGEGVRKQNSQYLIEMAHWSPLANFQKTHLHLATYEALASKQTKGLIN